MRNGNFGVGILVKCGLIKIVVMGIWCMVIIVCILG